MEHSNRFTQAVTKLYNAFHKGELEAYDCKKCAVGNICNGNSSWAMLTDKFIQFNKEKEDIPNIMNTGYSAKEIRDIERVFMWGYSSQKRYGKGALSETETKETQFEGLSNVIEYLCELEGIPNAMDYSKLFETENSEPKYKLESVLS